MLGAGLRVSAGGVHSRWTKKHLQPVAALAAAPGRASLVVCTAVNGNTIRVTGAAAVAIVMRQRIALLLVLLHATAMIG